jgi:hypothetical protein
LTLHSGFKLGPRDTALSDDGAERARPQLVVVGHGDRYRAGGKRFLHDDMAAATANLGEAVPGRDLADFAPGQNAQLTQQQPRRA